MLRLLLTLAAAVAIAYVAAEDVVLTNAQLYIYEEQINETLKNLSEKLAQKDPAFFPKISFNFENDVGKIDFEVQDIRLSGHSRFWATNLKISAVPPSMNFDVQFDEIHVLAPYYKIDALAVFIPFYGSGFLNLRSTVITLGGSARVKIGSSGVTGVSKVKARFNLKEANLTISGLLHNEPMSQIVSTATTECFPEFVNTYGERLGLLVGGVIEDILNEAMDPSSAEDDVSQTSGGNTLNVEGGTLKYYYEL